MRSGYARTLLASALLGLLVILGACGQGGQSSSPGAPADPGAQIFASRCAVCHATTTAAGIGPGLAGLFAPGGPTLPDGIDYGGKLPNGEAITEESVAAWIRSGGQGQIGRMPGIPLNDQEMTDLLAYLKRLEP
ncbi:MAG: hypothetical protein OHK0015_24110 [Chloroflexi bacterium OHK40]